MVPTKFTPIALCPALFPHTRPKCAHQRYIGCALLIIVSIGAFSLAGMGWKMYLHAHTFQVWKGNALFVIVVGLGIGGGALSLLIGLRTKGRPLSRYCAPPTTPIRPTESIGRVQTTQPSSAKVAAPVSVVRTTAPQKRLVYGLEIWGELWGIKVVDSPPPPPPVLWTNTDPFFKQPLSDNYILLYVPENIFVNGIQTPFTLECFKKMIGGSYFQYFSQFVLNKWGQNTTSGWVLLSTRSIPDSEKQHFQQQQLQGYYHKPRIFEAIVLNLLLVHVIQQRAYTTYILCEESQQLMHEQSSVMVGYINNSSQLTICSGENAHIDPWSAAVAVRFNNPIH